MMEFKQERARGGPVIYLTPSLWKGMRLDTSLASTPERSTSGTSALALRDVFSSWDANARVTVLGRGSSWTCRRSRDFATGKRKRRCVNQNAHVQKTCKKTNGVSTQNSAKGILLHAIFLRGLTAEYATTSAPDQINSQHSLSLVLNTYR